MTEVAAAREFRVTVPGDFGVKTDLDLWPRPQLSLERFLRIAEEKGARIVWMCSTLCPDGLWRSVLGARWEEGGCNVCLHGPADSREAGFRMEWR